jgi:hypothetical protein
MSKEDKGFLFFYSWIEPFAKLSPEEFKNVFLSLIEYQRNGTPLPNFGTAAAIVADFVTSMIDMRKEMSIQKRKNVEKRWNKNDTGVIQHDTGVIQHDTGVIPIEENRIEKNSIEEDRIEIPPYNPPMGKTTTTTTLACAKDEDKKRIEQVFSKLAKNDENLEDFIAYNDARGWLGIGGEDILKDDSTLTRYVRRWLKYETPSAEDEPPKVQPTKYISFDPNEALQRAVEKSLNKGKESESL